MWSCERESCLFIIVSKCCWFYLCNNLVCCSYGVLRSGYMLFRPGMSWLNPEGLSFKRAKKYLVKVHGIVPLRKRVDLRKLNSVLSRTDMESLKHAILMVSYVVVIVSRVGCKYCSKTGKI